MLPPVTAEPEAAGGARPGLPAGGPAAGQPAERTRVLVIPRRRRRELKRSPFPPPSPRRIWVSRAVLVAILAVQAALSLRMHNTAFEDEALYLTAGHYELAHLLYGVPLPQDYASFFSGSPVLYPILGALADTAGGLAAARLVSLAAMLATTALLYSLTRRLFNERIGLCAAVIFSVTESAIFLGNFATYDAPALCLLAVAAWIVVRTATVRWPVYLAAAPVAALAVGTKYAAALFVPTIVAMAALAAWPYQGKRALIRSVALGVAIAGLLAGALWLAGLRLRGRGHQHHHRPAARHYTDRRAAQGLPAVGRAAVRAGRDRVGGVRDGGAHRAGGADRTAGRPGAPDRARRGAHRDRAARPAGPDPSAHRRVVPEAHRVRAVLRRADGRHRAGPDHRRRFHRAQFGVAVWGGCLCSAWCRPATSTTPGRTACRWSPRCPGTWPRTRTTWSKCPRCRAIT